ncbi:ParM/StbA family protein [Paenibacillus sp. ISL-20]|uniref:ParM/StbA family protein n=1 Tax=Paenibacillus sp. ISL-20 TaxID=2819163 RepID=UPI001BEAA6B4|nr:ParM/StbA family protein [Paenibacillus sp. ISL-20]
MSNIDLSVIDLGFSYTKAKRGGITYIQPSISGEAQPLFEQNIKPNDFFYNEELFVGNLALRHSEIKYFTLKDNKSEAMTSEVLLKTGLGYLNKSQPFNMVTGLPISFYFNQLTDMEQMLNSISSSNVYSIKKGKGAYTDINLNINKYKIVPQGYGVAMDYILDDSGKIGRRDVARKKVLVVDLGFYTLNLLGLDKLEIMKESVSVFLGVEKAYKLLRKYLLDKIGKAPAIYELDPYVISGIYEGYDIRPLIQKAFRSLAIQVQNEIDGLNIKFDYYLIGGGAAFQIFDNLHLPNKILFDQIAQINGYGKIGVRLWGRK